MSKNAEETVEFAIREAIERTAHLTGFVPSDLEVLVPAIMRNLNASHLRWATRAWIDDVDDPSIVE